MQKNITDISEVKTLLEAQLSPDGAPNSIALIHEVLENFTADQWEAIVRDWAEDATDRVLTPNLFHMEMAEGDYIVAFYRQLMDHLTWSSRASLITGISLAIDNIVAEYLESPKSLKINRLENIMLLEKDIFQVLTFSQLYVLYQQLRSLGLNGRAAVLKAMGRNQANFSIHNSEQIIHYIRGDHDRFALFMGYLEAGDLFSAYKVAETFHISHIADPDAHTCLEKIKQCFLSLDETSIRGIFKVIQYSDTWFVSKTLEALGLEMAAYYELVNLDELYYETEFPQHVLEQDPHRRKWRVKLIERIFQRHNCYGPEAMAELMKIKEMKHECDGNSCDCGVARAYQILDQVKFVFDIE